MLPEDDVLDGVPRSLVKAHSFIPLFIDDDELLIACVDQPEHELEDELRLRYEVPIRPVIATPKTINQAIAKYYAPGMRDEAKLPAASADGKAAAKATGKTKTKGKKEGTKPAASPAVPFSQLSPDEQRERKQYGILFICWSIILPMAPQILGAISPRIMASVPISLIANIAITIPIAAATTWWVTQKYWK
jgi:hypothetical protein